MLKSKISSITGFGRYSKSAGTSTLKSGVYLNSSCIVSREFAPASCRGGVRTMMCERFLQKLNLAEQTLTEEETALQDKANVKEILRKHKVRL